MEFPKTKFDWHTWQWCAPEESLFTLDREALFIFRALVTQARGAEGTVMLLPAQQLADKLSAKEKANEQPMG